MAASEKYINFESVRVEDEILVVHDIKLNPFSIDAYYEIEIDIINDDGEDVSRDGTRIILKSGVIMDLMHGIDEFEKMLDK